MNSSTQFEVLPLPTPFDVGDVNCYLLNQNNTVTLFDPGPDMDDSFAVLKSKLDKRSLTITDVDNVCITHPHIDHFGLTEKIKSVSGSKVYAHKNAVNRIQEFRKTYKQERSFFEPFLIKMGMPAKTSEMVTQLPDTFTKLAPPVEVDHEIEPNEEIDLGEEVICIDSPGHSLGGITYVPRSISLALTGDHVLGEITPNALLQVDTEKGERTRSLIQYMESMSDLKERFSGKRTRALPGHGQPIDNLSERIEEIESHHFNRKAEISDMIDRPRTAFDLMEEQFPDLPLREYFMGMSEIIGHLDLLVEDNKIERRIEDDTVFYIPSE